MENHTSVGPHINWGTDKQFAVFADGFSVEGLKKHMEEMELSFEDGQEADRLSAIETLALKCRIDPLEELPPPPVAMQIKSAGGMVPLFTKGNFSVVTGAAKSRKSFLVSMLMAAAIKGEWQIFNCPSHGTNILFDTEQSRYKVQQISKRVALLCGRDITPSNFTSYSLRTLEPRDRMALIAHVLETTPDLNFVAIDGVIDLDVDPVLQADQAHNIILKLMQ